jgi:hypothetical protein
MQPESCAPYQHASHARCFAYAVELLGYRRFAGARTSQGQGKLPLEGAAPTALILQGDGCAVVIV